MEDREITQLPQTQNPEAGWLLCDPCVPQALPVTLMFGYFTLEMHEERTWQKECCITVDQ